MATNPRADMLALARAIHRRMREWETVNAAAFKIDNAMSRIVVGTITKIVEAPLPRR